MEISQTNHDGATVIRLSGEIWGRTGQPEQLKAEVKKLVDASSVRVVFNLSEVRLISSIGIGMLIGAFKAFTDAGGAMAIAEPNDPIKPVFRVLRGPFEVFETEGEAITYVLNSGEEK